MANISSEVLDIVKEAIQLEIDGRSFFNYAASATENKLGKKMFEKLANDEIQHLKTFGELFSASLGDDSWKQFVSDEEAKRSPLIEDLKARVKKEREKGVSEVEAIRIGMELERRAIDFFDESARSTSDGKTREICETIREEEKMHYDLLQAQYDSVTNSGFWFDVAEFQMDGKY